MHVVVAEIDEEAGRGGGIPVEFPSDPSAFSEADVTDGPP